MNELRRLGAAFGDVAGGIEDMLAKGKRYPACDYGDAIEHIVGALLQGIVPFLCLFVYVLI